MLKIQRFTFYAVFLFFPALASATTSYFQIPPGFDIYNCMTPVYGIGVSLVLFALAKFVVREVAALLRRIG